MIKDYVSLATEFIKYSFVSNILKFYMLINADFDRKMI